MPFWLALGRWRLADLCELLAMEGDLVRLCLRNETSKLANEQHLGSVMALAIKPYGPSLILELKW